MQRTSMHIRLTSNSIKGYCGFVCNDARVSNDSAKRLSEGWPFAGLLGGIGIMGTDA